MLIGYLIDYWHSKKMLHFYFYAHVLPSVRTFDCPKISDLTVRPRSKKYEFSPLCSLLSAFGIEMLESLWLKYSLVLEKFCVKKSCASNIPILNRILVKYWFISFTTLWLLVIHVVLDMYFFHEIRNVSCIFCFVSLCNNDHHIFFGFLSLFFHKWHAK